MAQGRSRPAWAEIDLAAVAHNAAVLARLVAPAELCAVVKAHGYGHGGPAVARAALAGGAAAAGRRAGRRGGRAARARRHRAGPPAERVRPRRRGDRAVLRAHADAVLRRRGSPPSARPRPPPGRPVAVHVKVDTGMHRVGAAPEDLRDVAAAVRRPSRCCSSRGSGRTCPWPTASDEEDRAFTEGQLDLFDRLVADLAAAGIRRPLLHAANTAGAIAFPRSRHDMVRCGHRPLRLPARAAPVQAAFDEQAGGERLRPAMALKARVVAVRTLDAGERPSYGRLRPLPGALARGHRPDRLRRRRAPRASSTAATRSSSAACAGPWPAW